VFEIASFYWAPGGTAGSDTLAPEIVSLSRDPRFMALTWSVGVLKVMGGVLMAPHGGSNLAARGLMAVGLIGAPESMNTLAAHWYLVLWDPWFVLGGLLFAAVTRSYQRNLPAHCVGSN